MAACTCKHSQCATFYDPFSTSNTHSYAFCHCCMLWLLLLMGAYNDYLNDVIPISYSMIFIINWHSLNERARVCVLSNFNAHNLLKLIYICDSKSILCLSDIATWSDVFEWNLFKSRILHIRNSKITKNQAHALLKGFMQMLCSPFDHRNFESFVKMSHLCLRNIEKLGAVTTMSAYKHLN